MHVVIPCSHSSSIGTLVVVYKRAVTEIQGHVRLIVAKDITPEGLAPRNISGQKQCHPAPQQYLILFESASCKNSDTSCSESRRKFDRVKFIRNRYIYICKPIFNNDATKYFKIQFLKSSNPHSKRTRTISLFYLVYVSMNALPGIVDGARKTLQGGK